MWIPNTPVWGPGWPTVGLKATPRSFEPQVPAVPSLPTSWADLMCK